MAPEPLHPLLILTGLFVLLAGGSRVQAIAVTRGWIEPWVGRKMAHFGLGSAVLVSWVFYPVAPWSRWLAAVPPLATAAYFALVARGVVHDPGTLEGGSRTGTGMGLLRGPMLYSAVFVVLTVVFWRHSPVGIAALGFMTLGDGMAEVVGRTVRSPQLPWCATKSVAGSTAALLFGWAGAMLAVGLLTVTGFVDAPLATFAIPMVWVVAVGAAVESLPYGEIDNATAPLACVAMGLIVL